MWELDYKENWALKNWCFLIVVLEKTLESPLDCKEIQPLHRRSVLGVHWKDWCWSWNSSTLATWCEELTQWKRPWCWERLRAGGEGDNRGWDGWLDNITDSMDVSLGRLGVGDGQGGLACYGSWGRKESNTTERLNWNWTTEFKHEKITKHIDYSTEVRLPDSAFSATHHVDNIEI